MHFFIKPEPFGNIKIEYHDPTDTGRIVSQTFSHPEGHAEPLSKVRKILSHVESSGNNVPRIAIKREIKSEKKEEVILVNGFWDTTNKIPNSAPEMNSFHTEGANPYKNFHHVGNMDFSMSRDLVSPSPRGSDSGIESDCTDGNLSWLLNYKIQELPPVPDAVTESTPKSVPNEIMNILPSKPTDEVSDNYKTMNQNQPTQTGPKKPPFTYTELIEHALTEKGELTVSGIYNWISEHFPYYKANDDRWKNSVRHNLSINPHFRKGGKAVHGAGHLWIIAQRDESKTWQMKQRIDDFIRTSRKNATNTSKVNDQDDFDKELQAATESILGEIRDTSTEECQVSNSSKENHFNDEEIHVEFITIPEGTSGLEDFLAPPVSKQELVNECGLGSDFFITDINPNQLGINLTEAEVAEDGIYDEMSFGYYGMKE